MKKKIMYLDVARILATFAVIVIHVASSKPNWGAFGFDSYEWNIFNLFAGCSRWAVPVFCMISGSLFLDPDRRVDTKKLYTKNVFRMITSFVFWSAFYIVERYETNQSLTTAKLIQKFALGHYHMWFLFLIVGFYIVVPILRKITADKEATKYFTAISLIFTIVVPTLLLHPKLDWASKGLDKTFMFLPLGYTCYFLLGYLINKFEMKKWLKAVIFITGPVSFVFATIVTSAKSQELGSYYGVLNEYDSVTVLLQSLFVFVATKSIIEKIKFKPKSEKLISSLSKDTFGVYFLHPVAITTIGTLFNLHSATFNPLLCIPLIVISAYIVSEIISHILNKIPVVKNYLV
ncbi:MAG: acyltransferase family protein [Clostridia bacterium]|nr:acyltransferase family protein [Clostridia bacterium]